MFDVILSVYACGPNKGSEIGLGWNWVCQLSNYVQIHVLTESMYKDEIEHELQNWSLLYKPTFYYIDVGGEKVRSMCWNQGDYRFYYYYKKWQNKAYKQAKEIIKNNAISLTHHLNMIGYREPGYLWKIKEVPFIWGPIGGFNFVPRSFLPALGKKNYIFYSFKNLINKLQANYSPRVKGAVNNASLLISASSNTKIALKSFFDKESFLLNETGSNPIKNALISKDKNNRMLRILWVGRMIPTKMLLLTIDVLASLENTDYIIDIIGDGQDLVIAKRNAQVKKVDKHCNWRGLIAHSEVQNLMRSADVLFFPSIVEGTPHVVLEALANGLPVICHNNAGHGAAVNEKCGFKIEQISPENSKVEFTKIIDRLISDKSILRELSLNSIERAKELSWENKAKIMFEKYKSVIEAYQND